MVNHLKVWLDWLWSTLWAKFVIRKRRKKRSTYFFHFKRVRFQTFEFLHIHEYYVCMYCTQNICQHSAHTFTFYLLLLLSHLLLLLCPCCNMLLSRTTLLHLLVTHYIYTMYSTHTSCYIALLYHHDVGGVITTLGRISNNCSYSDSSLPLWLLLVVPLLYHDDGGGVITTLVRISVVTVHIRILAYSYDRCLLYHYFCLWHRL